jgi:hypothetical protein
MASRKGTPGCQAKNLYYVKCTLDYCSGNIEAALFNLTMLSQKLNEERRVGICLSDRTLKKQFQYCGVTVNKIVRRFYTRRN